MAFKKPFVPGQLIAKINQILTKSCASKAQITSIRSQGRDYIKRAPRLYAWAGDVDRPLDEFDSHSSPLHTGMGSRSSLEALRDGDLLTARFLCSRLLGIDPVERFDAGKGPRAH